jgi:cytoskeletal protein CcmA (bactofilin family)
MHRTFAAFLLGLIFSLSCMAQDSSTARTDPVIHDLGPDHFAAGQNVVVNMPVAGDLIVAGREVTVENQVAGDAVLAGRSVRFDSAVSGNVYAAGAEVLLNGVVNRNARLAGGRVETSPSSRVEGGISIAAGEARVNGPVRGYLQAAAGNLYINGPIEGDVEVFSNQIELGPATRINGRFRYRARELKRDPAAQILGGIEQLPMPPAATGRGFARAFSVVWTLGLMLVVIILIATLPDFFSGVSQTLRSRPGASALLGLAILVAVPVVSVVLLVTVLGAPLALLSIGVYLVLVMIGYLAAGASLGDWFLKRWQPAHAGELRWRIGAAVVAILLLGLIAQVPLLGGLGLLAALLLGMGAVGLHVQRAMRPATPAPV